MVVRTLMSLYCGLATNLDVSMATTLSVTDENSLKLVGSVVFRRRTHK